MTVQLLVLGAGDAFGSGGRMQTCFLLRGAGDAVLVDCGASSLIAMRRLGVDPLELRWVIISHLHGDHFGGLPFLLRHAQLAGRTAPLSIAGPRGVAARVTSATETFFPGRLAQRFEIDFVELAARTPRTVGPAQITAVEVEHHSGAPSLGLRVRYGDRTFAYSGDTQWTDALEEIARDSDLFVCECYTLDRPQRFHLDYRDLDRRRERLGARRIVLTHMGQDVLAAAGDLDFPALADGQVLDL